MEISLGFSPCPNDTFIFDALVNQKIDTKGLTFKPFIADVEILNKKAITSDLMVSKLSYFALAQHNQNYIICDSGSALGNNVGPLIICDGKQNLTELTNRLSNGDLSLKIAIPGKLTTANFLFSVAFPKQNKNINISEVLFSEIENKVLSGEFDLGLVIHESRFTYHERGLQKIMDCGSYWQEQFKMPIPLGGIAVERKLDVKLQKTIVGLINESILYAFKNVEDVLPCVRIHAQTMSDEVIFQHIKLNVNNYTVSLGEAGKNAVKGLFSKTKELGFVNHIYEPIFINY